MVFINFSILQNKTKVTLLQNANYAIQARHNFSKTEGAVQKLGGQNIKMIGLLKFLGRNFKENR